MNKFEVNKFELNKFEKTQTFTLLRQGITVISARAVAGARGLGGWGRGGLVGAQQHP